MQKRIFSSCFAFCITRKRIRKKQSWIPLERFPRHHNLKLDSWRKTRLPKRELWQVMVLNLLTQVSLLGWDVFISKFWWRNSPWRSLTIMQKLCFPCRNLYIGIMSRSFLAQIQKSIFWFLLGPLENLEGLSYKTLCVLANEALKLLLQQITLEIPAGTFKLVTVHLMVHFSFLF